VIWLIYKFASGEFASLRVASLQVSIRYSQTRIPIAHPTIPQIA